MFKKILRWINSKMYEYNSKHFLALVERLSKLNPESFTVQDVSNLMFLPKSISKEIIKTGVRQGYFGINHNDGTYFLVEKEDES